MKKDLSIKQIYDDFVSKFILSDTEKEVLMKDLAASQIQQTANIVDMTYARLRDCPIESTPIYGRQAIFTCPNSYNSCGCNGTSQFI